jgi:hypothetical protein
MAIEYVTGPSDVKIALAALRMLLGKSRQGLWPQHSPTMTMTARNYGVDIPKL